MAQQDLTHTVALLFAQRRCSSTASSGHSSGPSVGSYLVLGLATGIGADLEIQFCADACSSRLPRIRPDAEWRRRMLRLAHAGWRLISRAGVIVLPHRVWLHEQLELASSDTLSKMVDGGERDDACRRAKGLLVPCRRDHRVRGAARRHFRRRLPPGFHPGAFGGRSLDSADGADDARQPRRHRRGDRLVHRRDHMSANAGSTRSCWCCRSISSAKLRSGRPRSFAGLQAVFWAAVAGADGLRADRAWPQGSSAPEYIGSYSEAERSVCGFRASAMTRQAAPGPRHRQRHAMSAEIMRLQLPDVPVMISGFPGRGIPADAAAEAAAAPRLARQEDGDCRRMRRCRTTCRPG